MFSNNNNSLEDSSVPTSTTPGTESVTVIEQPANLAAANAALSLSGSCSGAALPLGHSPAQNSTSQSGKLNQEDVSHEMQKELLSLMGLEQLPEMETFEVELVKDQQGLGITIAGYVCEKGKDGKLRQSNTCHLSRITINRTDKPVERCFREDLQRVTPSPVVRCR